MTWSFNVDDPALTTSTRMTFPVGLTDRKLVERPIRLAKSGWLLWEQAHPVVVVRWLFAPWWCLLRSWAGQCVALGPRW